MHHRNFYSFAWLIHHMVSMLLGRVCAWYCDGKGGGGGEVMRWKCAGETSVEIGWVARVRPCVFCLIGSIQQQCWKQEWGGGGGIWSVNIRSEPNNRIAAWNIRDHHRLYYALYSRITTAINQCCGTIKAHTQTRTRPANWINGDFLCGE